jgi:hypothetical protein
MKLSQSHPQDFSNILKVIRVYVYSQRFFNMLQTRLAEQPGWWWKLTYRFNNIVKITLSAEDSTGPTNDPVSIGDEASALSRTALQDI